MCAGAAYWTGIGRVVYGMSNRRLFEFTGDKPGRTSFALPCRDILQHGSRPSPSWDRSSKTRRPEAMSGTGT